MKWCVPAILVCAVLVGCGGGEEEPASDEEQVTEVVETFVVAMADGDGGTACPLLVPEVREEMTSFVGFAPWERGDDGEPVDCEDAFPEMRSLIGEIDEELGGGDLLDAMKFASIEEVVVRGDEAEVTLESEDFVAGPQAVRLVRAEPAGGSGAAWLIEELPGIGDPRSGEPLA